MLDEDIVYHLGDVFTDMESDEMRDILSRLNGKKYLIKGNHDLSYSNNEWRELGLCVCVERGLVDYAPVSLDLITYTIKEMGDSGCVFSKFRRGK